MRGERLPCGFGDSAVVESRHLFATTKTWLDETLAEITEENPDQFVFVLTHPMIEGTVYGSDLGTYWATSDITDILSKYPQVVTFGGHLHFPLNDPRSIMQTTFTSLGCGSVRYMAIENGGYEDMASATTMNDKDEFSQGCSCRLTGMAICVSPAWTSIMKKPLETRGLSKVRRRTVPI